MYSDGLKLLETWIKYLAIALLIIGLYWDINALMGISVGLFLGMAVGFFIAWRNQNKLDIECDKIRKGIEDHLDYLRKERQNMEDENE